MRKNKTLGVLLAIAVVFVSSGLINITNAATAFSVSANGNSSVQVGQGSSYQVSVSDGGNALTNGLVDVEVHDASGAKVYQQFFSNQNFNAGQAQSYNISWTPSSAGAYTLQVGVFSANWSSVLYWTTAMTLQASAATPNFSSAANVAQSGTVGQPVQLGFNIQDTGNASVSNAIVDMEVENASGAQVYQRYVQGQNFGAGQTQSYGVAWTPTSAGTYTVSVGVFSANWSSLLYWNAAAHLTVAAQAQNVANSTIVTAAATTVVASTGTVSGAKTTAASASGFYVDPNSSAAAQAVAWASSDPAGAAEMELIASQPQATWFGGWNTNVTADVNALVTAAQASSTTPVLVAYNIPDRDCGGYSAGGAQTPAAYATWIQQFAAGIGSRPAIVILEPDALASMDCLSAADQATRESLLTYAVQTLKSLGQTKVYVDAGNSNWISASTMAVRLQAADIAAADGFSLNVSNFYTTASNEQYGAALSALVGGKHFVIDTSRNGNGSNGGQWCNPSGMALGALPTTNTGSSLTDALLWVKPPGESDGTCNGGPSAGTWWPQYAAGLAQAAGY